MWFYFNSVVLLTLGLLINILTISVMTRRHWRKHFPRPPHTNRPKGTSIRNNLIYRIRSPIFYRLFLSLLPLKLRSYPWIRRVLATNRHSPLKPPRSTTPQHFCAIGLWCIHYLSPSQPAEGNHKHILQALFITIALGVYFTLLQASQYYEVPFTISDGVYGSTFFIATGFHGLHVIIGSTFLVVCFLRQLNSTSHPTTTSASKLLLDTDIL